VLWEACHEIEIDSMWACNARATDVKIYKNSTRKWDYYLGALGQWANNQQVINDCALALYNVWQGSIDGSEWEACTPA
jgi:hypothetical protein